MNEFLIAFVSFMSGLLIAVIGYCILCVLVGEDDKLVVFKSRKLSKRERIEKLENEVKDLIDKVRRIDYSFLISVQSYEYARRMAERNKNK